MAMKMQRVRQYFISKQVFEALHPLLYLTYLHGLTPFRVAKNKQGNTFMKTSWFGYVNIALYTVLYGGCYLTSLLHEESVVGYFFRTKISAVGDTMQIFSGLVTGTVIYVSAIAHRRKLLRVIDILHSLDENFVKIGVKVKYTRIYRFSLVMIIIKFLILGGYFVGVYRLLKSINVTPSFCVCVTFFLQHSVLSVAIGLFCLIARSFERRLIILNKVNEHKIWSPST